MEDIRQNGGILSDAIQHITSEAVKGSGLFEPYSIILATTATIGEHAMLIAGSLANQRFTNFKVRKSLKDCYNPYYLYYYFFKIDKWCLRNTNAGGLLSVDIPSLKRENLYAPSIKEQEKIASFLSLIDERISTQIGLIEDLKKLKSAITYMLYKSVKGERYSYRQLFTIINERNKNVAFKNILSASQELGMVERNDLNIDIKFEQSNINTYKIVRKGDYVIHLRSFQGGFAFSEKVGVCSPAYTILRPNGLLEYGYLSYFFTSKPFINSLRLVTYGIRDGRSINVDEWLDMEITLPDKEEQRRMLNIIDSVSNKIENETKILDNFTKQRQYLLRMMFV